MTTHNSRPQAEAAGAELNFDKISVDRAQDKCHSQTPTALQRVVIALKASGCSPQGSRARCPAHADSSPSLSFKSATEFAGVVIKCHAGCSLEDIRTALGLGLWDLYDEPREAAPSRVIETYEYADENGELLFVKERIDPKSFRIKRPVGSGWAYTLNDRDRPAEPTRRVLYRLPELLVGMADGRRVYVPEGEKDVDRLFAMAEIATCNFDGAAKAGQTPKWRPEYGDVLAGADVIVIADRDDAGYAHARAVAADLVGKARSVVVVQATVGNDISDHLDAGKGLDELEPVPAAGKAIEPASLSEAHAVFRRWLGDSFDLGALNVVLAAAAVEQLDGDPLWLLILSGAGNAKTETVSALSGAGAHVTSTITSEGALLSATSKKEQASNATGGLLRKIGDRGILVIKDFTSILSMNRDSRATVLAAMREVYDGRWERNVGSNGGQTLTWTGRIVMVGAVTSAYDKAHAVIASMGDRFALVRVDSNLGRLESGMQALRNVGDEVQMRAELAEVVGRVLAGLKSARAVLPAADLPVLLGAANLVTLARTAVEHDYKGAVMDAHQPEAPTRFAKMLGQCVRGGLALGLDLNEALGLAMRVAGDSIPPLRLQVLGSVLEHPDSTTTDVTKRLQRPRSSVDRTLQELHQIGLLVCVTGDGYVGEVGMEGEVGQRSWRYSLHSDVDEAMLGRSHHQKCLYTWIQENKGREQAASGYY